MNDPSVSILLPTYNESNYILQTLLSILSQDYTGWMEVLVSDGMSTDDTLSIISKFSTLHPELKIHILENHKRIVSTGLNLALSYAHGEVIIRVDGHTIIASDYVRQCVETLHRTEADNVGGKMTAVGINQFGKAVAIATSNPFGIGGGKFHFSEKEEWVDTVYMGAWPRSVFNQVGLFDEELVRNQDDEFNYRIRKNGGKILLYPAIKSEYNVRSTPIALWCQYYLYGFWKVRVMQKHPLQMSVRQFIPPIFMLILVVSLFSIFIVQWGWLLWGLVFGSYIIASLLSSIIIATNRGWRYLILLPVVFGILHFGYGLGFLVGLIRFANRWR